jgi:flagellar hook-associated protein 1 FlgK
MGTLNSLMDLTRNALESNQAALAIVGNNVANQNTVGYTRETPTFASDEVTIGGPSGLTTSETSVTSVSQRSRVLEQMVQQQTQVVGQSTAQQGALNQLQTVFGLTTTATSDVGTTIGDAITGLYSSFSALANSPSDLASRQAVLSAASTLTAAFQSASSQISSINTGISQTAGTVVSEINGLTSTIAGLNQQIATQSPTKDAGVLEDERQAAITQLSGYTGLDQVTTENNGITLSLTNGTVLVDGSQSYALVSGLSGSQTTIATTGSAVDISGQITGGQLGGLLSVQQQTIAPLNNSLDQLAFAIGTTINTQNALGTDENGAIGGAVFTLPPTAAGAASSIAVAAAITPSAIAAAGLGQGTAGNSNANALSALSSTAIVGGDTATSYFSGVLSGLGTAVSSATTAVTAQQAALTQLTTQNSAVSGVSLDDEASNLEQYQRSYQAASQLFTIVDTLFQAAINIGTSTTV